MKYSEPKANEWVQPVKVGYRLACCDCGLVHDMDFRVKSGRIQFRARRNNRATSGIRVRKGLRKNKNGTWYAASNE